MSLPSLGILLLMVDDNVSGFNKLTEKEGGSVLDLVDFEETLSKAFPDNKTLQNKEGR